MKLKGILNKNNIKFCYISLGHPILNLFYLFILFNEKDSSYLMVLKFILQIPVYIGIIYVEFLILNYFPKTKINIKNFLSLKLGMAPLLISSGFYLIILHALMTLNFGESGMGIVSAFIAIPLYAITSILSIIIFFSHVFIATEKSH